MEHNFEQLKVWMKAFELAEEIILFVQRSFPKYSKLADQLLASAVSVPSNIAEGSERSSNADFKRFLSIASGSNAELRTQLMLSQKYLQLENDEVIVEMISKSREIGRMLNGLYKSL
ncbi:MAG: four helix bundle protein [Bacteroidota bacterium]|nr:four helix bundle protein [Bacteroidota bacterium]MDX5431258.1 four helix bundle protein [Bacteroidota bacterium]MDX5469997.1 four helix bundle protein [Bacteroidota bacterium]